MTNDRKDLQHIDLNMAEIAAWARQTACKSPERVEIDDQLLPWIYHRRAKVWCSFDGNWSRISPDEKHKKHDELIRNRWKSEERAAEDAAQKIEWGIIRAHVLERDNHTCQICGGKKTTPLHVHHICKRKEGGGDTPDNLMTVCNKCHKGADTKLYDPHWDK